MFKEFGNVRQELRVKFNKSSRATKVLILLTLVTFVFVIISAFLTAFFTPQEISKQQPNPVIQGGFTPPPYRPPLNSPTATPSSEINDILEEPSTNSATP